MGSSLSLTPLDSCKLMRPFKHQLQSATLRLARHVYFASVPGGLASAVAGCIEKSTRMRPGLGGHCK